MLAFYPCFLLPWIREWSRWWNVNDDILLFGMWEWSTCWDYIKMFFHFGLESGQHVDILPCFLLYLIREWSTCWDSNEYVILFLSRVWSTWWDSVNLFLYVGLESCHHVDILHMFSIALGSRVVNMLRFYEYVILLRIRKWSACWDSNTYILLFGIWLWSTCWRLIHMFF